MQFAVPTQDLAYSQRLVPTRPRDGFVIAQVCTTLTAEAVIRSLAESPRLQPAHGALGDESALSTI